MKRKPTLIGLLAVCAAVLAACGHDRSSSQTSTPPPPPPGNTAVAVNTNQLLTQYATQPSETAAPVPVNDGAFTFTDTSETATPISVNGN